MHISFSFDTTLAKEHKTIVLCPIFPKKPIQITEQLLLTHADKQLHLIIKEMIQQECTLREKSPFIKAKNPHFAFFRLFGKKGIELLQKLVAKRLVTIDEKHLPPNICIPSIIFSPLPNYTTCYLTNKFITTKAHPMTRTTTIPITIKVM